MQKPRALRPGDLLGLIAPSGPAPETTLAGAVAGLETMGFGVKVYESCRQQYGYLAGPDEIRARDVQSAFDDPQVKGIVCLKGGYGTPRILDRLDYAAIAAHPKVFAGYSDITGLHLALSRCCGLVTFHAPMPMTLGGGRDPFTWDNWLRALTSTEPLGTLCNPPDEPVETLVPGRARGAVIGGNLSLVAASLGTPYEIDTRGRLLLLEDVGEEPYTLDRMLSQLRLAGKFADCAGVILGDYEDCGPKDDKPALTLTQVFTDVVAPAGKPAIVNLQAGHCAHKVTVPLGVEAELDADAGTLTIMESAAV